MINPTIARLEQDPETLHKHWCLPPNAARFLYLLARIGRCRQSLEVGTSIGYSTLHLAQAARENGGRVTTIDASGERQMQAIHHLRDAGLLATVTMIENDALTALGMLAGLGYRCDLMFLDARKSEYQAYLHLAETLLLPGGILLADNTRSHRKQMTDFLKEMQSSPSWQACELETPEGLVLARHKET